jgi:hypothetical protein
VVGQLDDLNELRSLKATGAAPINLMKRKISAIVLRDEKTTARSQPAAMGTSRMPRTAPDRPSTGHPRSQSSVTSISPSATAKVNAQKFSKMNGSNGAPPISVEHSSLTNYIKLIY